MATEPSTSTTPTGTFWSSPSAPHFGTEARPRRVLDDGWRVRSRSALERHPADEDHVVIRRALAGAYDSSRPSTEAFQLVMGHRAKARVRKQLAQSGWQRLVAPKQLVGDDDLLDLKLVGDCPGDVQHRRQTATNGQVNTGDSGWDGQAGVGDYQQIG